MQVKYIDHIQLAMPAGEEAAARYFYAGMLGIPEVPKPPKLAKRGGVWFERGAMRVHLGVEANFIAAKKAHLAFRVSDLPGFHRIYVDDPFANRLEFMEAKPSA